MTKVKHDEGKGTILPLIKKKTPEQIKVESIETLLCNKIRSVNSSHGEKSKDMDTQVIRFTEDMKYTPEEILIATQKHFNDQGYMPCERKAYGFLAVKGNEKFEINVFRSQGYFELFIFNQSEYLSNLET